MELNKYQDIAGETAIYDKNNPISYCILGMVGEAGEVANKYKKVLRGDKKLTEDLKDAMCNELGDVLWYIAMLARELDCDLNTIAEMNIEKLMRRREEGTIQGDGDNR